MKAKKIVILICVLIGLLSACGGQSKVPESLIEMEIEDYIYNEYENYSNYEYEIYHNFDNQSNIDYVTVQLTVEYPCWIYYVTGEFSYQYINNGDYWELNYNYSGWEDDEFEVKKNAYIGTHEGTYSDVWESGSYVLKVEDFDEDSWTVTCSYDISTPRTNYSGSGTYSLEPYYCYRLYIEDAYFMFYFGESGVHGAKK